MAKAEAQRKSGMHFIILYLAELEENKRYYANLENMYQTKLKNLEETCNLKNTANERVFTAKLEEMERAIETHKEEKEYQNSQKAKLEYDLTMAAREAQKLADQSTAARRKAEEKMAKLTTVIEELTVQKAALEDRLQLITDEAKKKIDSLNAQINERNSQIQQIQEYQSRIELQSNNHDNFINHIRHMLMGLEQELQQLISILNDTSNMNKLKEVQLKWIPEEADWNVYILKNYIRF